MDDLDLFWGTSTLRERFTKHCRSIILGSLQSKSDCSRGILEQGLSIYPRLQVVTQWCAKYRERAQYEHDSILLFTSGAFSQVSEGFYHSFPGGIAARDKAQLECSAVKWALIIVPVCTYAGLIV